MSFTTRVGRASLWALLLTVVGMPLSALADSGFYVGGSIGGASIEADIEDDPQLPTLPDEIDEDDTGFKVFGGFLWDNPLIDLGVEVGYVDFGEPEVNVPTNVGDVEVGFETSGINLWGIAGTELGPLDVFAKLGYVSWDIEASIQRIQGDVSDDGNDIGYGLGAAFNLGALQIRGEWELYDIDDADVSMLSLGVAFRF
ncbi:MAG: outer membrane beta-barrel protein [Pseudomonadota bacterium]